MKKKLGEGGDEEGVEYWTENNEQTTDDDDEEKNKDREQGQSADTQNEIGKY